MKIKSSQKGIVIVNFEDILIPLFSATKAPRHQVFLATDYTDYTDFLATEFTGDTENSQLCVPGGGNAPNIVCVLAAAFVHKGLLPFYKADCFSLILPKFSNPKWNFCS